MFVFGGFTFPLHSLAVAITVDRVAPGQITAATATLVRLTGVAAAICPAVAGAITGATTEASTTTTLGVESLHRARRAEPPLVAAPDPVQNLPGCHGWTSSPPNLGRRLGCGHGGVCAGRGAVTC